MTEFWNKIVSMKKKISVPWNSDLDTPIPKVVFRHRILLLLVVVESAVKKEDQMSSDNRRTSNLLLVAAPFPLSVVKVVADGDVVLVGPSADRKMTDGVLLILSKISFLLDSSSAPEAL